MLVYMMSLLEIKELYQEISELLKISESTMSVVTQKMFVFQLFGYVFILYV